MNQPNTLILTELLESLKTKGVQILDIENINTWRDSPNFIEVKGSAQTLLEFIEKNSLKFVVMNSRGLNPNVIEKFTILYDEKNVLDIKQTAHKQEFEKFCSQCEREYKERNIALDVKQEIISNLNNIGFSEFYLFKEGFIFRFILIETWYQLLQSYDF